MRSALPTTTSNARSLLSFSSTDELRDFATNYGPIAAEFRDKVGVNTIANSRADLLDRLDRAFRSGKTPASFGACREVDEDAPY